MAGSSQLSLFSQKLDRAVFASYFLGAVVPLLALGAVVHRFVLPALADDTTATHAMVGLLVGVGALALAAFFALRRLTHNALRRMKDDNDRLATLLAASRKLSVAPHGRVVVETAAGCALALSGARCVVTLVQTRKQKALDVGESAGEGTQQILAACESSIRELAEAALEDGHAARGPLSGGRQGVWAAAVPWRHEGGGGAFVLVFDGPKRLLPPGRQDAVATLAALTAVALHSAELRDSQRNFFAHTTEMLVAALDAHVDGRLGHATGVAQVANRLGRELGIEGERLQRLHFASLLHDIGMLKIDRVHQCNPAYFRKHPALGQRMLSRIRLWEDLADIVLHHHEHFDGAGYPDGLEGIRIPLESRIIAVADAYDAMLRDDIHSPALDREAALREIVESSGTQFDPDVVRAFAALAERGELG